MRKRFGFDFVEFRGSVCSWFPYHADSENCAQDPQDQHGAGTKLAIERGWLVMHDSGTFVTLTSAGAELLA